MAKIVLFSLIAIHKIQFASTFFLSTYSKLQRLQETGFKKNLLPCNNKHLSTSKLLFQQKKQATKNLKNK